MYDIIANNRQGMGVKRTIFFRPKVKYSKYLSRTTCCLATSFNPSTIQNLLDNRDLSPVNMPPKCRASENCSLTVDVILQSSDGKQLGAHSKNLELFTDAFPVAGSTLPPHDGEVVKLTESAEILRLVLSYTHNTPPPDLSSLDLDTLLLLGEVVIKKYGMYLAGECVNKEVNLRISNSPPLKILAYKTRVSDFSLIDETAQKTMDSPLEDALSILDPSVFRVWV
ncbi:hypothetical protein F5051DRAFT_474598 [Lentinula edodes]|nr:hypothetical protein F5051DRAFT_474598 [Lentinula edodes]